MRRFVIFVLLLAFIMQGLWAAILPPTHERSQYTTLLGTAGAGAAVLISLDQKLLTSGSNNSAALSSYMLSHVKGVLGEQLTSTNYTERLGPTWKSITPRGNSIQGLDHLFVKFTQRGPEGVVVVDSKFTKSPIQIALNNQTKSGMQMSHEWVSARIHRDIIPDYEELIELEKQGYISDLTKPAMDEPYAVRHITDENSYIKFSKDGQWYYSGRNLEKASRIKYLDSVRDYLSGVANGKIDYRRRVVNYQIKENVLYETVYGLTDIPGEYSVLERRIIDSNDLESFFQNSSIWKEITNKYGAPFAHYSKFPIEEKLELLDYSGDPARISNSRVVQKLYNENRIARYTIELTSTAKFATVAALFSATVGIISQINQDGFENVDYAEIGRDVSETLVSSAIYRTTSHLTENIANRASLAMVSEAITKGANPIFRSIAKEFIPQGLDVVIGIGLDSFLIQRDRTRYGFSDEVVKARTARAIQINSATFAISLGTVAVASVIATPVIGAGIGWGANIASGILLELLVPMPSEYDERIIRSQLKNNPAIIDEWLIPTEAKTAGR